MTTRLDRIATLEEILGEERTALKEDMTADIGRHIRVKHPICLIETGVALIVGVQWTFNGRPAYSTQTREGITVRPLYPDEVEFLDESIFSLGEGETAGERIIDNLQRRTHEAGIADNS